MTETADNATIRLYHYTAMRWGMKTLWERRLKISQYKDVNDPFELIPFDRSKPSERRRWEAEVQRLFASDHGMICFSETWQNPLMWSHYGDKHTGMCMGFDVLRGHTAPVTYIDRPLPPPDPASIRRPSMRAQALEAAVLRYKHSGWQHEREWRVRVPLKTRHEQLYFFPFDAGLQLREVILGPRCALKPSDVVEAIQSPPLGVDIYAARAAYGAFAVERHEVVDAQSVRGFREALDRAPVVTSGAFDEMDD